MAEKKMETVQEIAARLNCCDETVRRMIHSGDIPHVKVRRTYRLDPEKVILALSKDSKDSAK